MKHTEKTKKILSEKRKKWLDDNPDKHPWRKKNKFKSIPCEYLKNYLKSLNIKYEEESIVSNIKNYSVDILIPNKNLIIEVNGNQHYNKDGTLKKYYKERHDHIKNKGFNIIEMHYSLVYNEDLVNNILNKYNKVDKILEFKTYLEYKNEIEQKKVLKNQEKEFKKKRKEEKIENIKNNILISNVNFKKFGWVKQVSKIIKIKPQKVNCWMIKNMPDFYKKCYIRNKRT